MRDCVLVLREPRYCHARRARCNPFSALLVGAGCIGEIGKVDERPSRILRHRFYQKASATGPDQRRPLQRRMCSDHTIEVRRQDLHLFFTPTESKITPCIFISVAGIASYGSCDSRTACSLRLRSVVGACMLIVRRPEFARQPVNIGCGGKPLIHDVGLFAAKSDAMRNAAQRRASDALINKLAADEPGCVVATTCCNASR